MLLLFLGIAIAPAQQALSASGGNATGSGGSVSYTFGQMVYTTQTGSGGSVTQGVQVPYEITIVTSVETSKDFNLSYSVYPNPTTDNLTLKIDIANGIKYNATLFDVKGKQMLSFQIEGNETSISMQEYAPAIYFLKITNNNKEVKTFKIIKN
jgi:hypothetical protein